MRSGCPTRARARPPTDVFLVKDARLGHLSAVPIAWVVRAAVGVAWSHARDGVARVALQLPCSDMCDVDAGHGDLTDEHEVDFSKDFAFLHDKTQKIFWPRGAPALELGL
jgi:hypothetical protein